MFKIIIIQVPIISEKDQNSGINDNHSDGESEDEMDTKPSFPLIIRQFWETHNHVGSKYYNLVNCISYYNFVILLVIITMTLFMTCLFFLVFYGVYLQDKFTEIRRDNIDICYMNSCSEASVYNCSDSNTTNSIVYNHNYSDNTDNCTMIIQKCSVSFTRKKKIIQIMIEQSYLQLHDRDFENGFECMINYDTTKTKCGLTPRDCSFKITEEIYFTILLSFGIPFTILFIACSLYLSMLYRRLLIMDDNYQKVK